MASLTDLANEADLLDQYGCAVLVGHNVYWSRKMRDHVDQWAEAGGRVAGFAGYFMWPVREVTYTG